MKNFRIFGFLLLVVVMSTLLEGCFRKGENDPFVSLRSRKARMTGVWDITEFKGDYLRKLNSGENRKIDLIQSGTSISETTHYIDMTEATQDSLFCTTSDTTIEWKGKMIEAFYDIRKDGSFDYAFEYTLEMTHSTDFPEGSSTIGMFAPTNNPFRLDSTMKRNIRTEFRGRWNFLYDVDGYKKKERIVFEIESVTYLWNNAITYVYDFEDDDLPIETDTTYSTQNFASTSQKYANGEFAFLWEIDKLKNLEITLMRDVDQITTQASTGSSGSKNTEKGSELLEMVQEKE